MLPAAPILLLHGQPGSARDWAGVRAELASDARTIAIDRPGWDGRTTPAGLGGNAEAARAALDLGGIERATVVGHSLGAAVAAWLAVAHPERVAALVLVAPSANVESLSPLDYVLAAPIVGYPAGVAALAAAGLALTCAPLRRWLGRTLTLDDRYVKGVGRALLAPSTWRAFVSDQRALIRDLPALEARLHRISAPTSIVAGTADRVVPISAARRLSEQIPGAELVALEREGHLLPQRNPNRLARLIAAADARGR
jgi:pimeloyl-ACP methyl ester carboxylesterase